ncbi:hypothetical protein NA56DRAFT_699912 [Hyaloscypha hepaticicola]|uniref:Uncharacterized protein n=1 Tax=Hyaloscypha hepaticicola TaxID=2082293 RepID=A0A2J6QFQ2_9HELO|nr:hypothetical protein NA56DRAFT_699912 [Hyaloscypha hepaticicola]
MPEQEDSLFEPEQVSVRLHPKTAPAIDAVGRPLLNVRKDRLKTFQKRKASALAAGGMYRDSVVQFVSVCKAAPPSEYASTRGVWLLSFVVARTVVSLMHPQSSAACLNIRFGLRSPMIPGGRRWSQINPIQIHATAVIVDGVFVSKFVSMWIFEGDWGLYIFPLRLQVELRREVDNRRVIGFDFENACSDEKAGNCRFALATLVAAGRVEFVEEVWEAWGLAATSVKMLWKERLCTISVVVPAPRGGCCCPSATHSTAQWHMHARRNVQEAEPGPGQGAKRRRPPVGNLAWTGAGCFRGSFAICPVPLLAIGRFRGSRPLDSLSHSPIGERPDDCGEFPQNGDARHAREKQLPTAEAAATCLPSPSLFSVCPHGISSFAGDGVGPNKVRHEVILQLFQLPRLGSTSGPRSSRHQGSRTMAPGFVWDRDHQKSPHYVVDALNNGCSGGSSHKLPNPGFVACILMQYRFEFGCHNNHSRHGSAAGICMPCHISPLPEPKEEGVSGTFQEQTPNILISLEDGGWRFTEGICI